jgi:hypothetical protein
MAMASIVHKQQVGVIVVQYIQWVSLEVIHDVLSRKIPLKHTEKLVCELHDDIFMILLLLIFWVEIYFEPAFYKFSRSQGSDTTGFLLNMRKGRFKMVGPTWPTNPVFDPSP